MTEFAAFLLLAVLISGALAVWLWYRFASQELLRLQEYEYYANRFFDASNALIRDPDTPPAAIELVEVLNNLICERKRARRFLELYQVFAVNRVAPRRHSPTTLEIREFLKQRNPLTEQFAESLMCGLLALSFLGNGWGVRARAALADSMAREPKPTAVIEAVEEYRGALPQAA